MVPDRDWSLSLDASKHASGAEIKAEVHKEPKNLQVLEDISDQAQEKNVEKINNAGDKINISTKEQDYKENVLNNDKVKTVYAE